MAIRVKTIRLSCLARIICQNYRPQAISLEKVSCATSSNVANLGSKVGVSLVSNSVYEVILIPSSLLENLAKTSDQLCSKAQKPVFMVFCVAPLRCFVKETLI